MNDDETIPSQNAEKPSVGTEWAAETRAEANRLSDKERDFYMARALELIYEGTKEQACANRS
jgi:hypothetical protein